MSLDSQIQSKPKYVQAILIALPTLAVIDIFVHAYIRFFTDFRSASMNPLYKATGNTWLAFLMLSYFIAYVKRPSTSFAHFLAVFLGTPFLLLFVLSELYPLLKYLFNY